MAYSEIVQNGTTSQTYNLFHFDYSWPGFVDKMPSIRSLLSTFGVLSQSVLGLRIQRPPAFDLLDSNNSSSQSCPHPQLSCHNSTAVSNLCCFNAPGGSLLQTQFWDTDPASGPESSFTIHGLWPDNCDGTYSANCDASRTYSNITAILEAAGQNDLLDYMQKYWTSNQDRAVNFWKHEWNKHGTCISTLEPNCYASGSTSNGLSVAEEGVVDYFQTTVSLFKTLPTYDWLAAAGIKPSTSKTYDLSNIQSALSSKHGGKSVYIGCTDDGAIEEVWYFYNVLGSVQTGKFVPADSVGTSSSCPDSGVKYLPKNGGSGGGGSSSATATATATATSSSAPSPTGPAFSGKGYLNVITGGSKKGCIISYGTWFTSGTCATFSTSSSSDNTFTLSSSKGECGIQGGELVCGEDVSEAASFSSDENGLVYDGKSTFYADNVPTGSQQETVYSSGDGHGTELSIEWQGA